MGNYFILVNFDTREYIRFLGYSKEMEIIANVITSQMVAYFLFNNNGKKIYFVGDQWNVGGVFANFDETVQNFKDVTYEILQEMLDDNYIEYEKLKQFASWDKDILKLNSKEG